MEEHDKFAELQKVEVHQRLRKVWPIWKAILERKRNNPNPKTIVQYQRACQRMEATGFAPEMIGKKNRKSFNLYRAAAVYDAYSHLDRLHQEMTIRCLTPSIERLLQIISEVEKYLAILERYPPNNKSEPSLWQHPVGGPSRKSKRVGLGKRPRDWRTRFCNAAAIGTPFHRALLVLALTGARPDEIQKGINVSVTDSWTLQFVIAGSKVTGISGQAWRQLEIRIDNPIAWQLADIVRDDSGGLNQVTISIDDARQFCDDVKSLSRLISPGEKYIVSPYSFRHQFAADLKTAGVSVEILAIAMGHQSGRSSRAYGVVRQGGRCPLVGLVSASAATAIRHTDRLQGLMPPKEIKASKSQTTAPETDVIGK